MTPTPPAAPCTEPGHERIMIEVPGEYDGGLYYRCMQCGKRWHRWREGDWRHEKAKKYVEDHPHA